MSNEASNPVALANEFAGMLDTAAPNGVTVVSQPETEEIEVQQQRGRGKAPAAPKPPAAPAKTFVQQSFWRGFLDRTLPTAESLKVYKRVEGGKMTFINTYSVQDIQSCPDMEIFLQRYLMPHHGAGEYEVALTNSKGETSRVIAFNITDPNPKEKPSQDRTTEKVIDKLFSQQEELRKQLAERPKEPSMGDKLAEMKAMMDLFGGGDGSKKSMDPMAMIMMMKMFAKDDAPRGPDPAIMAALEGIKTVAQSVADLSKEVREMKNQPLPAPMPLPDPGPSPMELVKAIADAVRPAAPVQPPMNPMDMLRTIKDLMPQPQSMQPKDMLGIAAAALPMLEKVFGKNEITDLKQQIQQIANGGSRGLREVLQDMQMLQQVMGGGESDSDSFWAVAGKLVDNIGEVAAVVDALRSDDEEEKPKKKQVSQSTQVRREEIKKKAKKVVQRVVDEKMDKQEMPLGFEKKVARIENAEDGHHAIDATLKAFFFLARKRPDPFKAYLNGFMELAAIAAKNGPESEEAKTKLVGYVEMFLNGLKSRGILKDEECVARTTEAFRENIDKVVKFLTSPPPEAEAPKEA